MSGRAGRAIPQDATRPFLICKGDNSLLRTLLILALVFTLAGCAQSGVDGTYSADDGEGTRVTVKLERGQVQLWQGDISEPPFMGEYRVEGDRIFMVIEGRDMLLAKDGRCLFPVEDPSQKICRD